MKKQIGHRSLPSVGFVLALLTVGCGQADVVGSSSAAVSLGSGPASASISGATTAQGTNDSTPTATSGGNYNVCGVTGHWEADIYAITGGASTTYNVRYVITNTSGGSSSINQVQLTDFSNDGTVDVNYRTDLGSSSDKAPGSVSRSSGDTAIIFDFSSHPIANGTQSRPFFVNANSSTYGSSGEIDLFVAGHGGPCTITTSANYPHN